MKNIMICLVFLLFSATLTAQTVTISIEIPSAISLDVVDAFAWRHDYVDKKEITGGTEESPVYETKGAFAKRIVRQMIRSTYISYMEQAASRAAGASAATTAGTSAKTITIQ